MTKEELRKMWEAHGFRLSESADRAPQNGVLPMILNFISYATGFANIKTQKTLLLQHNGCQ